MRVLVVDDHAVVREGVRTLLGTLPGATMLEASSGQEALAALRTHRPDLVLLDLNLPGSSGFELLRRLVLADSQARVLVFSMHAEPLYALKALEAGACGYVSKSAPADELLTAISRVAKGGRYVEREIAGEIAVGQFSTADPLHDLTARETDILRLLGEGRSLSGIAQSLGVAYKTVANSLSRLKTKLGVTRTADLIRLSVELNRDVRERG